jgi:hypothetical protein
MTEETNAVEENENDNVADSLLDDATPTETPDVEASSEESSDSATYEIPDKFMNDDGDVNIEALVKSYTNLEQKMGTKIGAESIDEYDYEFQHEGVFQTEGEEFDAFRQQMLDLGLSKDQYSGLMGIYEDTTMDLIEQLAPTPERAQEALSEVWGDDFEANLQDARAAYDAFAPEDMDINTIGNNPEILQILANIGRLMHEDTGLNNGTAVPNSGLTELEVQEMMNRDDYWTNAEVQRQVAEYFASKG